MRGCRQFSHDNDLTMKGVSSAYSAKGNHMCNSWNIDNYLTLASIMIMLAGGVFALVQWNSSQKFKRLKFLDEIINKLRFDPEMAHTLYTIDYDRHWYTNEFHNNRDLEYKIDKVLSYFDFICCLYNTKNIKNDEFNVIKYRVVRICISPSVQKYLWNLYHFSAKMGTPCSFANIVDYGIKNKIIKKEFRYNNKDLYGDCKYLNF